MQTFNFSTEEINLMCIYNTKSKTVLLSELRESLSDVYEPEMREVFESTIEKLDAMTDEDFAGIGFFAAGEYYEGEEWWIA